jgi:hypothetical protein
MFEILDTVRSFLTPAGPEGVMMACDPVTLTAMLVISAASAATSYQQANYAAKATEAKQKQLADLSVKETALAISDASLEKDDTRIAVVKEQAELKRKGIQLTSTGTVAALEGGADGAALDALVNDYWSREAQLTYASQTQADLATFHIDREIERIQLHGAAKTASIFRPINQASPGKHMLDFAGDAMQIGGDYVGERGAFKKV